MSLIPGQEAIIVIGGYNGKALDSVEVLMPDETQWIEGPILPMPITSSELVQDVSVSDFINNFFEIFQCRK